MSQLTESQMKYLHVIYKATSTNRSIRSVDVARELNITKASVSRMIKLLAEMDLIHIKARGYIELTSAGQCEGCMIHRKFEDIYPFFADYLELEAEEATESVYFFLSVFSDRCVEMLLKKGWNQVLA